MFKFFISHDQAQLLDFLKKCNNQNNGENIANIHIQNHLTNNAIINARSNNKYTNTNIQSNHSFNSISQVVLIADRSCVNITAFLSIFITQ